MTKPSGSFITAAAQHHNPSRVKCSVYLLLETMPPDLRGEVIEAMGIPMERLSAPAITAELKVRGFEVDEQAIRRHRAAKCKCPDELRRVS